MTCYTFDLRRICKKWARLPLVKGQPKWSYNRHGQAFGRTRSHWYGNHQRLRALCRRWVYDQKSLKQRCEIRKKQSIEKLGIDYSGSFPLFKEAFISFNILFDRFAQDLRCKRISTYLRQNQSKAELFRVWQHFIGVVYLYFLYAIPFKSFSCKLDTKNALDHKVRSCFWK